jgi:S1-C subfamily serine protease
MGVAWVLRRSSDNQPVNKAEKGDATQVEQQAREAKDAAPDKNAASKEPAGQATPKAPPTPKANSDTGSTSDLRATLQPGSSLATAVDSVRRAVVTIVQDEQGFGSGFVVQRRRWLATNHHVVAGAKKAAAFRKLDGATEPITIEVEGFVACDPRADLVILALEKDWPAEPLRLSGKKPRLGDDVFAIGTPKGLTETVTKGIISQLRYAADLGQENFAPTTKIIQTDTFITHGSSGGPLCATSGHVMGINTFGLKTDTGKDDFHFAVSVEELSRLLQKAGGRIRPLAELPRARE